MTDFLLMDSGTRTCTHNTTLSIRTASDVSEINGIILTVVEKCCVLQVEWRVAVTKLGASATWEFLWKHVTDIFMVCCKFL